MKKIPTLFVRSAETPALVLPTWNPECLWVRDGEGIATRKWDGSAVLVRHGLMYKRRELRDGDGVPANFEPVDTDLVTLKTVGWMPVGDGPDDQWHRAAWRVKTWEDGTYELVGPKVQGNNDGLDIHTLVPHGKQVIDELDLVDREFDSLRAWLTEHTVEGLVFWHPDGRKAKIKRRDFGLAWGREQRAGSFLRRGR